MRDRVRDGVDAYVGWWRESRAIPALFVLTIGIYLLITWFPHTTELLVIAAEPAGISDRPWTVLTGFFAHELTSHLLVNLGILVVFGLRYEVAVGPRHVWVTYVGAGLAGNVAFLATAAIDADPGVLPGGSAAALGLLGAIATSRPSDSVLDSPLAYWLAIGVLFNVTLLVAAAVGALQVGIGVGSAHLAGIAFGVGYGGVLRRAGRA